MSIKQRSLKTVFILFLSASWLLSGWPPLWHNPRFPLSITPGYAATTTFGPGSSGNWTAPYTGTVTVEAWGGGGSGGGGQNSNGAGGGGGAGGQYSIKVVSVTKDSSYAYSVGSDVTGVGRDSDGNLGNDTTFASTTVIAKGGAGGIRNAGGGTGGTGTTSGGVGDTVYAGGTGGTATSGNGGGGGSGAGSTGTGNNGGAPTAGSFKANYGGAGGAGGVGNSTSGDPASSASDHYGGGGGGSTRNGTSGSGRGGYMRITYNTPPSFSVTPSDSPDPVTSGSDVTFSATATDSENNTWYLVVCKTDSVTPGSPPTCQTDQTLCVSASAVSTGAQNTCTWASTGSGTQNWYAFACDSDGSNPLCSSASTTNSPVTVNSSATISISITTDGSISYGTIEQGGTISTLDVSDTQTAQNTSNVPVDLNIKSTQAVGVTNWDIAGSSGTDTFVHQFSATGGSGWTYFTSADSYESLATNVAVDATQDIDFRLTLPTFSSNYDQKTITVTVQAVEH